MASRTKPPGISTPHHREAGLLRHRGGRPAVARRMDEATGEAWNCAPPPGGDSKTRQRQAPALAAEYVFVSAPAVGGRRPPTIITRFVSNAKIMTPRRSLLTSPRWRRVTLHGLILRDRNNTT